jgi:hypothetical protein
MILSRGTGDADLAQRRAAVLAKQNERKRGGPHSSKVDGEPKLALRGASARDGGRLSSEVGNEGRWIARR